MVGVARLTRGLRSPQRSARAAERSCRGLASAQCDGRPRRAPFASAAPTLLTFSPCPAAQVGAKHAASKRLADLRRWLKRQGGALLPQTESVIALLREYARCGDVAALQLLTGAVVFDREEVNAVLFYSVQNGHAHFASYLIHSLGADVRARGGREDEREPLMIAAKSGSVETLDVLLEAGARVSGNFSCQASLQFFCALAGCAHACCTACLPVHQHAGPSPAGVTPWGCHKR